MSEHFYSDAPVSPGNVFVFGAGGRAKVIIDAIRTAGRLEVGGILDDNEELTGTDVMNVPVLGAIDMATVTRFGITHAVIGIGDNHIRKELARRFATRIVWVPVLHPSAVMSADAMVGEGSVVCAGAVVQPATIIGKHSIINTCASVDHDCSIGDYVHIAPGCRVAGGVEIDDGALVGIGSAVLPRVKLGMWSTVGAGGVVIRDVPAKAIAIGIPAKYEQP